MKAKEMRNKSKEDLKKSVGELRKKLSDLRFTFAANRLKNVKEVSNTRKTIARTLTVIKELEKANEHQAPKR